MPLAQFAETLRKESQPPFGGVEPSPGALTFLGESLS
jgi:hypothetical protein